MSKRPPVRVNTRELSATQASIGRFEVRMKADRFKLMSPSDILGYVEEKRQKGKPPQVVRGLGRYFVVDGHHTLTAIVEASGHRELTLELAADLSSLHDTSAFWGEMAQRHFLYGKRLGEPVSPQAYPESLVDLDDDPFRSVAWLIRKMGAFDDLKQPYQEFLVADFLREHMRFTPSELWEYELACLRACELVRSPQAQAWAEAGNLPGFVSTKPVCKDPLAVYYDVLETARAPRYYRD